MGRHSVLPRLGDRPIRHAARPEMDALAVAPAPRPYQPRRLPVFAREPVRARLYALIAPVAGLLVGYGVVSEERSLLWVGVATVVLGPVAVECARARVTPVDPPPYAVDDPGADLGAGEVKALLVGAVTLALGLVLAALLFWALRSHGIPAGL